MTKTTTNLLGIIITILAGIWLYLMLCSECCGTVSNEPVDKEIAPAPEATSYPFAFSNNDYAYSVNDNFNFNVSSASILSPISTKVTDGIASLKAFLAENTGKVIDITGYYTGDEENDSAFPNLGLARANVVKNHFVENGIPSARINTFGELKSEMVAKDNVFMGPLAYTIHTMANNTEEELDALYAKIEDNPLILYFNTAETSINLTANQRQQFADISRYLDKVESATCTVVGHADNSGDAATNMRLGQERADFAKNYLMKNGIAASKIKASSKGQSEPIADNTTEEGKSKNRRTVVTITK